MGREGEVLWGWKVKNYVEGKVIYDKERREGEKGEMMRRIGVGRGMVMRGEKIVDGGEVIRKKRYGVVN